MKRDDIIGGVMLLVMLGAFGAFFAFAPEGRNSDAFGPVEIAGSALTAVASSDAAVEAVATFIEPGFITIHESIGGAPGPMIGSSGYIAAGNSQRVSISTSAMTPATPYIALLHVDNGDERLVIQDDKPVTSGGASVRADFTSL